MAERRRRARRTKSMHRPAITRSAERRLGARLRPRFRIRKLVPHENGLDDYAPESSWLDQADDRDDQVKQKEQEIAHLGNRTKSAKPLILTPIWNSPGTGL